MCHACVKWSTREKTDEWVKSKFTCQFFWTILFFLSFFFTPFFDSHLFFFLLVYAERSQPASERFIIFLILFKHGHSCNPFTWKHLSVYNHTYWVTPRGFSWAPTTMTARQKSDCTFSLSNVLKASMASFLFLKWYSFFGGGASSSLSELKQQMLNSWRVAKSWAWGKQIPS